MNTFTLGLIVLLYLFSLAYLGYLGYRKTTGASDYLIGGRSMNPIVMALSYGATFISASALVGFGGVAAAQGMGVQWLCMLNILVGVIIAFIFFGLRTRRMGVKLQASTFPEFFGNYYKSRGMRVYIAALIFISMPIYAAAVLKGGAVFIEQLFSVDYNISLLIFTLVIAAYVVAGGIKGVMYTDALQAVIMFVCTAFLLYYLYNRLGMGFSEANEALGNLANKVPEKFAATGHQGWTSMPAANSPQWYNLVTSVIFGVGIGCLAQPQLVIRFMTVKSTKELRRGVMIGTLFIFVTVGVMYHAGALSNLFYSLTQNGQVATEVVKDIDKIIPHFINSAMPEWFSALFMLCILSASMSTLSSQFHVMGASLGSDIVGAYRKETAQAKVIRLGVLISIVLSYVICYMLPADIIARATSFFMGLCAVVFLPSYFCALYWKRTTKKAALWSMAVGTVAILFFMLFVFDKTADTLGLCQALTGKVSLFHDSYPLNVIDPILYAFPISVVTIIVATLVCKKK